MTTPDDYDDAAAEAAWEGHRQDWLLEGRTEENERLRKLLREAGILLREACAAVDRPGLEPPRRWRDMIATIDKEE